MANNDFNLTKSRFAPFGKLKKRYASMKSLFLLAIVASPIAAACPLEGVWRTDEVKTNRSISNSAKLTEAQKEAVSSVLGEFEAIISCTKIVERHIGHHDFGEPLPDSVVDYDWSYNSENKLLVTVHGQDNFEDQLIVEIDSDGCMQISDLARDYTEYKCKVK